jgi:hypothetical protein
LHRWWVLVIVVSAQFMFGVDAFIVNATTPTPGDHGFWKAPPTESMD